MTTRTWWLAVAAVAALLVTGVVGLLTVPARPTGHPRAAAPATDAAVLGSAAGTTGPGRPVQGSATSPAVAAPAEPSARSTGPAVASPSQAVASPSQSPSQSPSPSQAGPTAPSPTQGGPASPTRPRANWIGIPAQGTLAPIDVCRIVAGGLLPPADVHRTCLWAGGAGVGARQGTTVLTGYVGLVGQGAGAFAHLAALRPGGVVLTAGPLGRARRWQVTQVIYRPMSEGILPTAFAGRAGPRRLFLVSAAGRYDPVAGAFLDNIYVLATPAPRT